MTASRSTREVFDSHLALRLKGRLEEDIALNYHPDVAPAPAAATKACATAPTAS